MCSKIVSVQNSRKSPVGSKLKLSSSNRRAKYKRLNRLHEISSVSDDVQFRNQLNHILSSLTEWFPQGLLESTIPFMELVKQDLYGVSNDTTMLTFCLGALDLSLTARGRLIQRNVFKEIVERFEADITVTDVRRAKLKIKRYLGGHRLRRKPVEEHYKVLKGLVHELTVKYDLLEKLKPALEILEELKEQNYVSKNKELTALTCILLNLDRKDKKIITTGLSKSKSKKIYNYSYRIKQKLEDNAS